MNTPHTPGPWIFCYGAVYQGDDANTVEENAGRIAQADRENPHTSPCERDANCRLIAAAPELLGALQYAVESEESTLGDGGSILGDDLRETIRAAIKKATGEP